ncbi:MAG: hypothetical protein AAGF85_20870, partial [Bacteroidota bacterium]
MNFVVGKYYSQPPELPTVVDSIEFIEGSPDSAFGRCSSSSNYTLPENQQLFSNSGFSIDEKGLYLSPSNSSNRLILWDYQYIFEQLKKVTWYFYNTTNSSIVLNLFSQILKQLEFPYRYSSFLTFTEFRDAGGTSRTNSFASIQNQFIPNQ